MSEQIITYEITREEDRTNSSTKLINLKTF